MKKQRKNDEEIRQSRMHQKVMQNCGMMAEIVEYRTTRDMDVQFTDGAIRYHVTYQSFEKGEIKHPDRLPENLAKQRLYETRTMNCGLEATIIVYRSAKDIDIMFENGAIRKHMRYSHFCEGKLNPLDKESRNRQYSEKYINLEARMNGGEMCKIIKYYESRNITVQFEDGLVRENQELKNFLNGQIAHPSKAYVKNGKERIGEKQKMKNGLAAEIIEYRSHIDIDIKFEDDVIVHSVRYGDFQRGEVGHPNIKYKCNMSIQEFAIYFYLRNYGFRKIKSGEWKNIGFERYELDFYNDEKNIAIEYDGGFHKSEDAYERDRNKNKKCKEFNIILYRLRDRELQKIDDGLSVEYILNKQIAHNFFDCKKELEEILTRHEIVFDENDIDFNRDMTMIMDEYNSTYINYYEKERLQKKVYHQSTKQNMMIVAYHDSNNVDVQFEDGAIRYNVTYNNFIKGMVGHPSKTSDVLARQRLHETKIMNNGLKATIIAYRSANDIDVQFEDGTIRYNITYSQFNKKKVARPDKKKQKTAHLK